MTLNDYEYENGVPISKPGSADMDGAVCFAVDRYVAWCLRLIIEARDRRK